MVIYIYMVIYSYIHIFSYHIFIIYSVIYSVIFHHIFNSGNQRKQYGCLLISGEVVEMLFNFLLMFIRSF